MDLERDATMSWNVQESAGSWWRYYPLFCTRLGHKDCQSKECGMKGKRKKNRKSVAAQILNERVKSEVIQVAIQNGEMILLKFICVPY